MTTSSDEPSHLIQLQKCIKSGRQAIFVSNCGIIYCSISALSCLLDCWSMDYHWCPLVALAISIAGVIFMRFLSRKVRHDVPAMETMYRTARELDRMKKVEHRNSTYCWHLIEQCEGAFKELFDKPLISQDEITEQWCLDNGYQLIQASPFEVGLIKDGRGIRTWWASEFDGQMPDFTNEKVLAIVRAHEQLIREGLI